MAAESDPTLTKRRVLGTANAASDLQPFNEFGLRSR